MAILRLSSGSIRSDFRWSFAARSGNSIAERYGMSKLDQQHRDQVSHDHFAFPAQEKEPIHDAAHVRNAVARFNQVRGVTDSERDEAWKRIKTAARKHGVSLHEDDWRELSDHSA